MQVVSSRESEALRTVHVQVDAGISQIGAASASGSVGVGRG